MKHDLQCVGISGGNREFRVAASATIAEVGEPIVISTTYTAGVSGTNTVTLAVADVQLIDAAGSALPFVGLCAKRFTVNAAGTVTAHKTLVTVPIANVTRIRGKAETKANIDTDSELLGVMWDLTLIDYNATGASDGGQLYTIKAPGTADLNAFTIVDGDSVKGTLDVIIDARALRTELTT